MDRNRLAAGGLGLLAVLVLVLALAAPAGAYVYWGNATAGAIGRAENDGSGVNPNFISGLSQPAGVAVDSAHIYWADESGGAIGRANLDGSGVNPNFISGLSQPSGVAVNSTSIYWSTLDGPIGRANIDGGSVKKEFIVGPAQSCGVALDGGHVYWADDVLAEAAVGRASLDGGIVQLKYVDIGSALPCGVAVNSASIYWADLGFLGGGNRIGRADTATGKSVDPSFIGGGSAPCGVALDSSSHLYWANLESGTIGRANSDGTAVNQNFLAAGDGQICGVAADSLSTPPPPPAPPAAGGGGGPPADTTPPLTKIAAGPGSKLAKGRASFSFRSSEVGATFTCKLDKQKPRACRSPKTYRGLKPGRHLFRVWASDPAGNKDPTPAKKRFRVPA